MKKEVKNVLKEKKSYSEPRLEKIAGIKELTKGIGGAGADNGFSVPPSQI